MRETQQLHVPKWPFFLADATCLGAGYFIYAQGKGPLTHWEITAVCICAGAGALLGIIPFIMEHRALLKLIETTALEDATARIQKMELVAAQISGATNHWQSAQEQADKTAANAKEIADRIVTEVREFSQFMEKISEGEKATLRLEVDKLRRGENEWLNVVVHTLDHTYALFRGAERSGQPNVIRQVGTFQNACRDVARRIGLAPVLASIDEPFDAKRHQWADGDAPPADSIISELVATGYTYQGKLIRPALVRVRNNGAPTSSSATEARQVNGPDQLLLEAEQSTAGQS